MKFPTGNRKRLGSWGIVGVILLACVVWMLTGLLGGEQHPAQAVEQSAAQPKTSFTVSARQQGAESIGRDVAINGDTQPDQVVNIAAQYEGQIIEVGPRKGARIEAGQVLARLHPRELEQHRIKAQAVVRTRELEFQGASKMRATGYVTEADLASREAALELARADRKDIEIRIEALTIKAPVSGIIEERTVDVGDYIKLGQSVVTLIKIDPLIVSGGVNESEIAYIKPGMAATAELLGQTLNGRVRFVSAMADPKTRTFTIEVAVDNPDSAIPAGLSARVRIPVEKMLAHRIPASLLSLADDGEVGVKHVVDGKVVFTHAQIVRADGDAVFVAGLPERITLITRGQGFVATGEAVEVQLEEAQAAQASPAQAQ